MLPAKRNEKEIAQLPMAARAALAAWIADRALREVEAGGGEVPDRDDYHTAVDLLWTYAIDQGLDYERDVRAIHDRVTRLIPETEDDPWPRPSLAGLAGVLGAGLSAIQRPEESARYVAAAGEVICTIFCVFRAEQNEDDIMDREGKLQDQAVALLRTRPDRPVSRHVFDDLPQPDYGPRMPGRDIEDE